MSQQKLFHDNIYDALTTDVNAIGGVKKVAAMLWPSLDVATASARLRSGLNTDHAQKLDAAEIMRIKMLARDAGSTATVEYEAQSLSYRVQWTTPEDELSRLHRDFIGAVDKLDRIKHEIKRTESRLMAVRA